MFWLGRPRSVDARKDGTNDRMTRPGCRLGPAAVSCRASVTGSHISFEGTMKFFHGIMKTFFTKRTTVSLGALLLCAAFASGCPVYPADRYRYLPPCTSAFD